MTEPEELIEARLVALLAPSIPGISVEGSLAPASEGEVKTGDDTFVNVTVDQGEPLLHAKNPTTIHNYSVVVTVHVAFADDKTGTFFRDVCRSVRGVLESLQGDDGAETIEDGVVDCRDFCIDSTKTDFEETESGAGMKKTYNATLWGSASQTTNP